MVQLSDKGRQEEVITEHLCHSHANDRQGRKETSDGREHVEQVVHAPVVLLVDGSRLELVVDKHVPVCVLLASLVAA